HRRLTRRILTLPGGQDLPQDHLGNLRTFHAGAPQRLLDCDFSQVMGRQVGKCPIERPDRGASGADDDNIVLHFSTPCLCVSRGCALAECPSRLTGTCRNSRITPDAGCMRPRVCRPNPWGAATPLSIARMADLFCVEWRLRVWSASDRRAPRPIDKSVARPKKNRLC